MKQIPLTQGKCALVDDEDYDHINRYKWCAHDDGPPYREHWVAVRTGSRKMAREILKAPKGMVVHHIDGDSLNNQKKNLLLITHAEHRTYHQHPKKFYK